MNTLVLHGPPDKADIRRWGLAAAIVVATHVALVAGFVLAYKKVGWFRAAVDALWQWLQKLWDAFLVIAKALFEKLKPALIFIGKAIKTYVIAYFKAWIAIIKVVWNVVRTVFVKVRDFITTVFNTIKKVGTTVWDGIVKGVKGVIESMKGTLNGIISLINKVIGGVNTMIGALNSVPGVPNLPTIPTIPQLAKGGVVMPRTGGTLALVAERGRPERVEPLDRNGLSARDRAMINELGGNGNVQVRVFIGETELTDIVQSTVSKNNRKVSRRILSGRQVGLA